MINEKCGVTNTREAEHPDMLMTTWKDWVTYQKGKVIFSSLFLRCRISYILSRLGHTVFCLTFLHLIFILGEGHIYYPTGIVFLSNDFQSAVIISGVYTYASDLPLRKTLLNSHELLVQKHHSFIPLISECLLYPQLYDVVNIHLTYINE